MVQALDDRSAGSSCYVAVHALLLSWQESWQEECTDSKISSTQDMVLGVFDPLNRIADKHVVAVGV